MAGFPYRRREWEILIFPAKRRHPLDEPKELRRWIPDSHVRLAEALEQYGAHFIADWDGSESTASRTTHDPDPPWDWMPDIAQKDGMFIISDKPEMVFVSEEKANAWWKEIEPILRRERDENLAAYRRMEDCCEKFRNALASEKIVAEIIDETGSFQPISPASWISNKGSLFMSSGVGEVVLFGVTQSTKYTGPIVFPRDFIELSSREVVAEKTIPREQIDQKQFPYLAFMLKATKSGLFKENVRTPKKAIEAWLNANWPKELGEPTDTKIRNMASFLRRPKDEKGGLH